jgi:hypothetical protein
MADLLRRGRLGLTGEILLSVVAGAAITLLFSALRETRAAAKATEVMLRPGLYVARKIGASGAGGSGTAFLGDVFVYGSLAFCAIRALSMRKRPQEPESGAEAERRRAHRILLAAPVFVYGWMRGEPFSENTQTLDVSALGGSLPLSVRAVPTQTLILINAQSNEESRCRVARAVLTPEGKTVVGFEFLHASPNFWSVDFASGDAPT